MATYAIQPSYMLASKNDWEESIVPTLRKRLENESRILSKRLSAHSITRIATDNSSSSDLAESNGPPFANYSAHYSSSSSALASRKERRGVVDQPSPPTSSSPIPRTPSDFRRPSAIPRPSMNREQSMPVEYRQVSGNASGPPKSSGGSSFRSPGQRARTRSSPYSFDHEGDDYPPNHGTGTGRLTPAVSTGIPTPAQSRSNSPMVPIPPAERPSRIPMATAKRPRSSSNAASTESTTRPTTASTVRKPNQPHGKPSKTSLKGRGLDPVHGAVAFPPSPDPSPEHWGRQDHEEHRMEEGDSSARLHALALSNLRDEAPIFNPNRISRASFEEREFEHWYRGEGRDGGGRNGGRGEIKVTKVDPATEMLEIAVGGHKIMDRRDRESWNKRRRADSLANRTSTGPLYADYQVEEPQMEFVTDERPLTDLDNDMTDDVRTPPQRKSMDTARASMSRETDRSSEVGHARRSTSRARDRQQSAFNSKSKHGGSASQSSRTTPSSPAPSRSHNPSRSATAASGSSRPSHTKPGSAGASASGPPDKRARSQSRPKRSRVPSVSQTPTKSSAAGQRHNPLVDAVPWTQPDHISRTGNWDDVVLPTVAKKMGLTPGGAAGGDIELAALDGGFHTKSKRKDEEEVYEPAPGTFGFDFTKRRPPKSSTRSHHTDEFGQGAEEMDDLPIPIPPPPKPVAPPSPQLPSPSPAPTPSRPEYEFPIRRESPAPFTNFTTPAVPEALYHGPPTETTHQPQMTTMTAVEASALNAANRHHRKPPVVEEDHGAGCCKCVIM